MTLSKEDLVITENENKNDNNLMVGGVKLNTFMSKMGLSPITKIEYRKKTEKETQKGGGILEDLAVPSILFIGSYLFNNDKSNTKKLLRKKNTRRNNKGKKSKKTKRNNK